MSKPKKIIITIVLVVLAVFIILALLWYLSRKSAEKNGNQPMSFRKFLGFESKVQPPADYPTGEYGSDFTSDQNGNSNTNDQTSGNSDKNNSPANANLSTNSSNFTNNFSSPSGVGSSSGNSSAGSGANSGSNSNTNNNNGGASSNGGSNGSNNSGNGSDQSPINLPGGQELVCSDADVNITFTPEELAQLQELQNRFYAVAQGLYNDSDVAAQIANYDTFKLKQTHINELLNYCQNAAPKITNPIYQRKVPTPFWYKPEDVVYNTVYSNFLSNNNQQLEDLQTQLNNLPDTDANAAARQNLINQISALSQNNPTARVPLGYFGIGWPGMVGGQIDSVYRDIDNQGPRNGYRSIEQVLRLNLW